MNNKENGRSDQAAAPLNGSDDGNPDDDDRSDHEGEGDPLNPDDSNAPDAGTSDQTGETLASPTQPWTYKEGQFWNYVDDELANFKKLVRSENPSASDADAQTTEYVLAHLLTSRSLI